MNSKIVKIEYYLPETILDNQQLAKEFAGWEPDKIEKKVGIRTRHISGENETALDLAIKSSEKALDGYDKNKIDFILLCTQSPDYYLPTSACILQNKLGLKTSAGAFDFNLGCSGFVYGLAVAKGLIAGRLAKSILLVTAETYSKHLHPKDIVNRTIFGDASASAIIESSDEDNIMEFSLGTDGAGFNNLIIPNGGMRCRFDHNAKENVDPAGSTRTDNNLFMNGPEIFNFTIESIPKLVNATLEINKLTLDSIDYVIFHQANKYMLEYLQKKIKIPAEKFYVNMLETGNTVSATIPIALKQCINSGVIKAGHKVLIVGFGVGYSWGATVIKI